MYSIPILGEKLKKLLWAAWFQPHKRLQEKQFIQTKTTLIKAKGFINIPVSSSIKFKQQEKQPIQSAKVKESRNLAVLLFPLHSKGQSIYTAQSGRLICQTVISHYEHQLAKISTNQNAQYSQAMPHCDWPELQIAGSSTVSPKTYSSADKLSKQTV